MKQIGFYLFMQEQEKSDEHLKLNVEDETNLVREQPATKREEEENSSFS